MWLFFLACLEVPLCVCSCWNLSTLSDLWMCLQKWLIRALELGRMIMQTDLSALSVPCFLTYPCSEEGNGTPKLARCLRNCRPEYLLWREGKSGIWRRHPYSTFCLRWKRCLSVVPFFLCCSWLTQIITEAGSRGGAENKKKEATPTHEALGGLAVSLTLWGAVALNWQKASRLKISHWLERSRWPGFPCHWELRQSLILMLTLLLQHSNF